MPDLDVPVHLRGVLKAQATRRCAFVFDDQHQCGSPAEADYHFCFNHRADKPPPPVKHDPLDVLPALCALDLADPANLKTFRAAMLELMLRGHLDSTRAMRACEIASTIALAGRDAESASTLTSLAGILKRALQSEPDAAPGGEGGKADEK